LGPLKPVTVGFEATSLKSGVEFDDH